MTRSTIKIDNDILYDIVDEFDAYVHDGGNIKIVSYNIFLGRLGIEYLSDGKTRHYDINLKDYTELARDRKLRKLGI